MVRFAELTSQNPWWKYGENFRRYDRHLNTLRNQTIKIERKKIKLQSGEIVVIRGCRQVGKSTYMKQVIADLIEQGTDPQTIIYISVDQLIKTRRELRNVINEFLTRNMDARQVYIFLDEVTALADWNQELKTLSDSGVTQKASLLITGSSGAALRNTGEQLPGRGLEGNEYIIKPLTFREYVLQTTDYFTSHSESNELAEALMRLKEILPLARIELDDEIQEIKKTCYQIIPYQRELNYLFNHYLKCGGFPLTINGYVKNRKQVLDPVIPENFVRITLGALADYGKNEATARQLLDDILVKYGSMFSFTSLSTQVNHVTTGNYLDYLEKSFLIYIHYAMDLNKKSPKYKGRKKTYFQDPFIFYSLKSWLTGRDVNDIISETLSSEITLGEIVEGIVTSHLITSHEIPYMREKNTFNWFYYDKRGK